jgi:hypothetical protein
MLVALLAVTLLEACDTTTGIKNLLLAGIERMAVGAYINRHVIARSGGTRNERIAARAGNLHCVIVGMDTLLHNVS